MGRFIELIPFREAVSRIHSTKWKPLSSETVKPQDSAGRIAFSEVVAQKDVPMWNRSLVDGYAVRLADCSGASDTNPVEMEINGVVEAGSSSYKSFRKGTTTEIYTGGIVPSDYDAVLMAEDVERHGNFIGLTSSPKAWENVKKRGEEIREGSTIIKESHVIRPWDITAMMSAGVGEIEVYEKLKIGVVSTGNELFEGSEGYIPNTTQRIFVDYLNRPFASASPAGVSHDITDEIRGYITDALENYDCVIVTGGTSLGGKDEVPEAMEGIGNIVFAGSMIRPGRTLTLYEAGGKPVFSVSGIPVPSLVSFDTYFEEYMKRATGLNSYRQEVNGILTAKVSNTAGYTGIFRVKYSAGKEGGKVELMKARGSGSIGSILHSNATLLVPAEVEGYPAGTMVTVKLFGDAS